MNKRSLILTINFSLIFPGLGHLYNGKLLLSILIFVLIHVSYFIFYFYITLLQIKLVIIALFVFIILNIVIYFFAIFHSIYLVKKQNNYTKKFYNKWYYYLIFILFSFLFFFIQPNIKNRIPSFKYNSKAMHPTVLLNEYLLGIYDKNNLFNYARGDLVLYIPPNKDKIVSLTRIVGVSGDKIYIKSNNLYINEILLQENIKEDIHYSMMDYLIKLKENEYSIIPKNYFFIMGDNRSNSYDSRFYGAISNNYIIGKPLFIYYSQDIKRIFKILSN